MEKRGLPIGAIVIFLALFGLVKAAYYGSSGSSFGGILSSIDPSLVTLSMLFIIIFAVVFFSLSKFIFRDNRAIASIISICVSVLSIYWFNKSVDVNGFTTHLGIDPTTLLIILPFLLIAAVIVFSNLRTRNGNKIGLGRVLIILGLLIIAVSFTNLLTHRTSAIIIGVILIVIGILLTLRRRRRELGGRGRTRIPRIRNPGRRRRNRRLGNIDMGPRSRGEGTLIIHANPPEARIIVPAIGQVLQGQTYYNRSIRAGIYKLKAKCPGYHHAIVKKFKIRSGKRKNVYVDFASSGRPPRVHGNRPVNPAGGAGPQEPVNPGPTASGGAPLQIEDQRKLTKKWQNQQKKMMKKQQKIEQRALDAANAGSGRPSTLDWDVEGRVAMSRKQQKENEEQFGGALVPVDRASRADEMRRIAMENRWQKKEQKHQIKEMLKESRAERKMIEANAGVQTNNALVPLNNAMIPMDSRQIAMQNKETKKEEAIEHHLMKSWQKDYADLSAVISSGDLKNIIKTSKSLLAKYHPDRHNNDPVATQISQQISGIFSQAKDQLKRGY